MKLSLIKLIKSEDTKKNIIKPIIIKQALRLALIGVVSGFMTLPTFAKSSHKHWQNGRLIIEFAPTLCKSSINYKKYSQCKESTPYVIGGLDMGGFDVSELNLRKYSICHSHTVPKLPILQARVLNRLIPDRKQQVAIWHQYGACSNIKATNYFRQIIQQSNELNLPKVVTMGNTITISRASLVQELTQNNAGLSSTSIQLLCQGTKNNLPTLSKIAICYKNGRYAQCEPKVANTCGNKLVVLGW